MVEGASAVTPEQLHDLFAALKNWGRWGPNDERGALNHLTPEGCRAASDLVREGVSISLGRDMPLTRRPRFHFPHNITC